jgi:hypothetical protein
MGELEKGKQWVGGLGRREMEKGDDDNRHISRRGNGNGNGIGGDVAVSLSCRLGSLCLSLSPSLNVYRKRLDDEDGERMKKQQQKRSNLTTPTHVRIHKHSPLV